MYQVKWLILLSRTNSHRPSMNSKAFWERMIILKYKKCSLSSELLLLFNHTGRKFTDVLFATEENSLQFFQRDFSLTYENHVFLPHTSFRDKMLSNHEQCYVLLLLSFPFPLDMFSVYMALTWFRRSKR